MKLSLVVPYIADSPERFDIVKRCLEVAENRTVNHGTEFVLINNGPNIWTTPKHWKHVQNEENIGVLPSFPQGLKESSNEIVAFIHSDVLLHETGWDQRIIDAFKADEDLGLAGLFGAKGLTPDGHRHSCMSNMLGKEWGACGCHEIAAHHHSVRTVDVQPAAMFDGVGLFFRRECLQELLDNTDSFASWRAPHHFYDRILGCKVVQQGWRMAVIGIGFDHWSGATAGGSEIYEKSARKWLAENGHEFTDDAIPDQVIYRIAEQQFFSEWDSQLPLWVDQNYTYRWGN